MDKLVESLDEQGNKLSPVLPSGKKNYLIDIDGTVGEDIPNEEPERMATAEAYPMLLKQLTDGISKDTIFVFLLHGLKNIEKLQRYGLMKRDSSIILC